MKHIESEMFRLFNL